MSELAQVQATRFAILASGRGSNARALVQAFKTKFIPATLAVVLSDQPGAPVLEMARAHGVEAAAVPRTGLSRCQHEQAMLAALTTWRVDHLLLAGYMRILSASFLQTFAGPILNIHPSLLPDFPGLHAAERQARAGRKVMGATVHVVDAGVDSGPVVLQGSLLRADDEKDDDVIARLLTEVEHVIYPRAVRLFLDRLTYAHS